MCDSTTWKLLTEAHWKLGDRLLYLKTPMMRGDDVAQMQGRLSWLGFDSGKVDGTFGQNTHRALADFQVNVGMAGDGICGTDTVAELERNYGRSSTTISNVKELLRFDRQTISTANKNIAVLSTLELNANSEILRMSLNRAGFYALSFCHYDLAVLAALCNHTSASVIIYLEFIPSLKSTVSFFKGFHYSSEIGLSIAKPLAQALQGMVEVTCKGSRHRILQLTNAPCIVISLSDTALWTQQMTSLAGLIAASLTQWFS